ncbi:hypothetical protein [Gloeocapsa sp. PCC 73106]|uniref:hypothetical protein n=1 Tax=Gloeocapsa sp. PCC 73106 TaxID=102232 RepID=UPI0002ACD7B2|nr:hypothetical protein [Gloeocapsa sp. PCC 73106]ELR97491.1 hypothetical protein GLO73106DRAFT_00013010 [Gloeocapsa sp. PCC 73106]
MNFSDELTFLIADFELFLKEISTDVLSDAKHREILMRIYEFLVNLQQQPKPEDKVERLAKVISDSVISKIPEIEGLKAEIEQLKSINNKILAKLINLTSVEGTSLGNGKITEAHKEKSTTIKALTDLLSTAPEENGDIWYLGLDFGTLGLAGVLFNANNQKQYPLYWSLKDLDGIVSEQFRFPTLIYQSMVQKSWLLGGLNFPEDTDVVIDNYKSYLNWSIPGLEDSEIISKLFLQLHGAQTKELTQGLLRRALGKLKGIIVNFPSSWSDTYHFNLRESILQTYLVQEARQIFYLEEAIASLLGRFKEQELAPGWTIVINAGNSTTEIALVNLPQNWQKLSYTDLSLETISYAQRAVEQDIIIRYIYPLFAQEIPAINSELPQPGKIEEFKRYQLDQYLQSYSFGFSFLEAARLIILMLQTQTRVNISLGAYNCAVNGHDFQETILQPYLSEQEQILEQMLTERNISTAEIRQVICSGGLSLVISHHLQAWIVSKFPETAVIIDTETENAIRVARGLAYLPLFPQLLNRSRHQYSDYFLLKELLHTLTVDIFTIEELIQKLAHRGINTRVCKKRLLSLLKGEFPPGLITTNLPGERSLILLEQKSYYRVNIPLRDYLNQSLATILSQSLQQVSEPLLVHLGS